MGKGRGRIGVEAEIFADKHREQVASNDPDASLPFSKRFQKSKSRGVSALIEPFRRQLQISLNRDIGKYVKDQIKSRQDAEPNSWLSLPELPTSEEVSSLSDLDTELVPNKIKGKWKSKEWYLGAHYNLLREDAVSPLREAIDKYRTDPTMLEDHNVAIYDKVYIVGFTFSQLGIAARIRFCAARTKYRVPWASSKRLVSGSIVALSPTNDNFTYQCIICVIAARPLSLVEQIIPEIDIYFGRVCDTSIDPQQEWVMIEAKQGYYEAHRYTMKALQKMYTESFPLASHICSLSSVTKPPIYLERNPIIDLSAAAGEDLKLSYRAVNILEDWPPVPDEGFDETQWTAIQQILTKPLAIIQGPPGTGKTYVSQIALEVLEHNRLPGDPPIIVAAQTNHALDQLLDHISVFDDNYIRLGGRSTNARVKEHALFEIRRKDRIADIPGGIFLKALKEWRLKCRSMLEIIRPLSHSTGAFSIDTLVDWNIISDEQGRSLTSGAEEWVVGEEAETDPVQLWLCKSLRAFEVDYHTNTYEFDESDEELEFEQVNEASAEYGVADEEEIDLLKGPWVDIKEDYTVVQNSATNLARAQKLLDTIQDLWKVPESLRGAMYQIMQQRLKSSICERFRNAALDYKRTIQNLQVGKWERDACFLKSAKIIGMTTTGLSKYRPLVASLKPKIILIEEAAEVIEAPITVACVESLEQLILIGDHKQLPGHCSVPELEGEPYHLNVSLFERLVQNGLAHKTLLQQRRMNPEFRELISSLYPGLRDHSSVIDRPSPSWGMGHIKSFFFTHAWPEFKDSNFSTYNEEEAKFIAKFYRYLILNQAEPSEITILTFYSGQRKQILKELRSDPDTRRLHHKIKTVDSYQGEENTIVILSLVRSNMENNIGFLRSENRSCVALSRAKYGFFLFGNATLLAKCSPFWAQVVAIMSSKKDRVGNRFPICCQRHGNVIFKKYVDDWNGNDGGCNVPCGEHLACGHCCPLRCHPFSHDCVKCGLKCSKQLSCGHVCQGLCFEQCSCQCFGSKGLGASGLLVDGGRKTDGSGEVL